MPHVPRNKCCYPDAVQVSYTPLDSNNWTSNPSSVQYALDNLAARVYDIEINGGGGGTGKYAETITGNNILNQFNIQHELATEDVVVQIFDSNNLLVSSQVEIVDTNNVLVTFYNPPGNGITYRIVVVG